MCAAADASLPPTLCPTDLTRQWRRRSVRCSQPRCAECAKKAGNAAGRHCPSCATPWTTSHACPLCLIRPLLLLSSATAAGGGEQRVPRHWRGEADGPPVWLHRHAGLHGVGRGGCGEWHNSGPGRQEGRDEGGGRHAACGQPAACRRCQPACLPDCVRRPLLLPACLPAFCLPARLPAYRGIVSDVCVSSSQGGCHLPLGPCSPPSLLALLSPSWQCLIPEVPFKLTGENGMFSYLDKVLSEKGHAVVCVAEGAGQVCVLACVWVVEWAGMGSGGRSSCAAGALHDSMPARSSGASAVALQHPQHPPSGLSFLSSLQPWRHRAPCGWQPPPACTALPVEPRGRTPAVPLPAAGHAECPGGQVRRQRQPHSEGRGHLAEERDEAALQGCRHQVHRPVVSARRPSLADRWPAVRCCLRAAARHRRSSICILGQRSLCCRAQRMLCRAADMLRPPHPLARPCSYLIRSIPTISGDRIYCKVGPGLKWSSVMSRLVCRRGDRIHCNVGLLLLLLLFWRTCHGVLLPCLWVCRSPHRHLAPHTSTPAHPPDATGAGAQRSACSVCGLYRRHHGTGEHPREPGAEVE